MGSGPDRILGVVDLYKQGYAGEIVIARNTVRGHDLVVKRQITIGSNDKLIFYDLSFVTTD